MNREEYLKFKWQPYPLPPASVLYSGRILHIRTDNQFLVLRTEKDQTVSEYAVTDLSLASVLRPGDVIAVDEFEKVYLLAPGEPVRTNIKRKNLQLWMLFLQAVRDFFVQKEFLEVTTPGLVPCPGTEPAIEVFSTEIKKGSTWQKAYLPTSPELHLKKALCLGLDQIFEIKNCYRNDELSEHHQPEFTMLEWYRAYNGLAAIETDILDMIRFLTSRFSRENLNYPQRFSSVTMAELFRRYAGVEITPKSTLEDYKALAEKLNVSVRGMESIDDYFFAVFLSVIEPNLPKNELIVVRNYPPFQAALARITSEGWADRMEVYFGGVELANGFNELNDPGEQERRFEEDLRKKKQLGRQEVGLDQDFLAYLKKGMPPAAGIALGVERLFMVLFGIKDIREIKLFPYS